AGPYLAIGPQWYIASPRILPGPEAGLLSRQRVFLLLLLDRAGRIRQVPSLQRRIRSLMLLSPSHPQQEQHGRYLLHRRTPFTATIGMSLTIARLKNVHQPTMSADFLSRGIPFRNRFPGGLLLWNCANRGQAQLCLKIGCAWRTLPVGTGRRLSNGRVASSMHEVPRLRSGFR